MQTKIICEVDDLVFGWYEPETEEFHIIEDVEDEETQDLIKRDDFRERLLEALEMYNESVREVFGEDLRSIWKRLDRIEEKLERR